MPARGGPSGRSCSPGGRRRARGGCRRGGCRCGSSPSGQRFCSARWSSRPYFCSFFSCFCSCFCLFPRSCFFSVYSCFGAYWDFSFWIDRHLGTCRDSATCSCADFRSSSCSWRPGPSAARAWGTRGAGDSPHDLLLPARGGVSRRCPPCTGLWASHSAARRACRTPRRTASATLLSAR